jgi:hypothetical protein
MARYRTKDEIDLAWNRIRRQITRDIDTRVMNVREEILNKALTKAWERYSEALESGDVIQLEDEATGWVDDVLTRQLGPVVEVSSGDVDDS